MFTGCGDGGGATTIGCGLMLDAATGGGCVGDAAGADAGGRVDTVVVSGRDTVCVATRPRSGARSAIPRDVLTLGAAARFERGCAEVCTGAAAVVGWCWRPARRSRRRSRCRIPGSPSAPKPSAPGSSRREMQPAVSASVVRATSRPTPTQRPWRRPRFPSRCGDCARVEIRVSVDLRSPTRSSLAMTMSPTTPSWRRSPSEPRSDRSPCRARWHTAARVPWRATRITISLSFAGSPGAAVDNDGGFSLSTRYITAAASRRRTGACR